jgi:hypothetical protein
MVLPSAAQETNQGQKQQQNNDWKKTVHLMKASAFTSYLEGATRVWSWGKIGAKLTRTWLLICSVEHWSMLNRAPEFDLYYVAYLKNDPAKEPIAASYSAPEVLAEAAHKAGRAKSDFELREIRKEEYERLKSLLL